MLEVGAIVVPTVVAETSREVAFLLQDTAAVAAICDSDFSSALLEAATECPTLRWIIGAQKPVGFETISLAKFDEENSDQIEAYPSLAFDAAGIYYTGGTTGKPKGCVHTHAGEVAQADLAMTA